MKLRRENLLGFGCKSINFYSESRQVMLEKLFKRDFGFPNPKLSDLGKSDSPDCRYTGD
jgi:hypothetical protein